MMNPTLRAALLASAVRLPVSRVSRAMPRGWDRPVLPRDARFVAVASWVDAGVPQCAVGAGVSPEAAEAALAARLEFVC